MSKMEQDDLKTILAELQQLRRKNSEASAETNRKLAELTEKIEEESTNNANRLAKMKNDVQRRDDLWKTKFEKLCCRVSDIEKNMARQVPDFRELIREEFAHSEPTPTSGLNPALENQIYKCSDWMEKQERKERRLNIVVKGFKPKNENLLEEVNLFFQNFFSMENVISLCRISNADKNSLLATVIDWNVKLNIMKLKSTKLQGINVYIENDLTPQERNIEYKLRMASKKVKALGKKVRLSYQKIQIDGAWLPWDKTLNDISKTQISAGPPSRLRNRSPTFAESVSPKNA